MRLPYLRMAARDETKKVGNFGGLNKGLVIAENEFSDMENMSSDQFPAISVRRRRGEVQGNLAKPNGIIHKNGLAYVDGTGMFYKGKKVADVTDSKKILVGMGAYIIVFPDKIMYNTASGEMKRLEQSWTQTAAATFEQTAEGSTFVKISSTGIGKFFQAHDGVTISGCGNSAFNKAVTIQEKADDYIIIIGDLKEKFTQDSGLKLERKVPDMDFVCESENRLWGCSNAKHEIYASKLGDPANWNAFEGISTDSYAVSVGSDGDFTGCISHLGYVMFFKEDTIHKIFGDKPSNYQVNTSTPVRGLAAGMEGTMEIVNETLIYTSRGDICSYDGAQPDSIGDPVRELGFRKGVAGHYEGKYYASMEDKSGNWGLYVYDLRMQMWHKEDDLHLKYMTYGDGNLYCIGADGNLFTIAGDKEEVIPWMVESGDMLDGTVDFKHVKKLQFHLKMEKNSEVSVFIRYDDNVEWEKVQTYRADYYRTHTVNLIPKRCQFYRYRLEGYGGAALVAMTRKVGQGSDIHGSL